MAKKLAKKDKLELYDRVSKYFEDVSKLVFAGIILADILKQDINTYFLLGGGIAVVAVFIKISYNMFKLSKEK